MGEHRAREKFAVLVLVEPGALDVEEAKPGEPGEGQGIDGELRERAVGAGVGLVVENMHRAVPHLQKVDMAGDGLVVRRVLGQKPDAVVALKRGDVGARQPDRHLDRHGHEIIGEHEALKFFVAQIIVADGGNDECCRAGGEVLLPSRGEPLAVDEVGGRLRCPHARGEKIVRTGLGHRFEEWREAGGEAGVFGAFRQQRELRPMTNRWWC